MAYKYNEYLGYEVDEDGYPNFDDPRYKSLKQQEERLGIVGRMQSSAPATKTDWDDLEQKAIENENLTAQIEENAQRRLQ